MKQLGISLKQESSVIKKEEKKAERKKKMKTIFVGADWAWRRGLMAEGGNLGFFCHLGGQFLIMEAVGKKKLPVTVLWVLRNLRPSDNKNKTVLPEAQLH